MSKPISVVMPVYDGVTQLDFTGPHQFLSRTPDQIIRLGATARYLTSVCSGSLILGAAGFLNGRRAACHWAWRELLPIFGAIVDESHIVRDGNLLSGGGVTAGIDFVLDLMAELRGQRVAEMVQLGLEYAPQPPVNSGRPDTAPAGILEAVNARTAASRAKRRARLNAWAGSHRVSRHA
jgi:cyclohexyl-isocyanide hydratase